MEERSGCKSLINFWVKGQEKKGDEDDQKGTRRVYKENLLGFDVVFGKETSPGIAFIGCPEGYFFFQVREKERTGMG